MNAGWSSLVARWAHNPKVGGSNPPPATTQRYIYLSRQTGAAARLVCTSPQSSLFNMAKLRFAPTSLGMLK